MNMQLVSPQSEARYKAQFQRPKKRGNCRQFGDFSLILFVFLFQFGDDVVELPLDVVDGFFDKAVFGGFQNLLGYFQQLP